MKSETLCVLITCYSAAFVAVDAVDYLDDSADATVFSQESSIQLLFYCCREEKQSKTPFLLLCLFAISLLFYVPFGHSLVNTGTRQCNLDQCILVLSNFFCNM